MADVFVSYARKDVALAQKVAGVLKAAGYDVWWDSELLPHHAFAQSIEEQVRSARSVVVVWSEHAVSSQWVRAEADLARSQNKLVQIRIDDCAPPLPFNQYQTADLRRWTGDERDPQWVKVMASIAHLTSKAAAAPAKGADPALGRADRRRQPAFYVVGAFLAVLSIGAGAGGVWLLHAVLARPSRGARIAVQPIEAIGDAPVLRNFAAGLSESLQDTLNQNKLQTLSRSDAATLRGADLAARLKALDVGLLFSGTVQSDADTVTVRTNLEDPVQHATLWSADVSGPITQPAQLRARVGALIVAVLNCSAQALNRKNGIDDSEALALFLHACDLAETSHHGMEDEKAGFAMLDAMREVARKAPNFAAAHSILAKHAAFLVGGLAAQTALRQEADREAHRALQIDPKDPDAFVALGLLAPARDFVLREHFFRQALAVSPAWPHANGFLANVMTDVGRLAEASTLYQRAVSINPLSLDWTEMAAKGLVWAGETKQADDDLSQLYELWPHDALTWVFQLQSLMAQSRWADALKLLDQADTRPGAASYPLKRWRAEIGALMTRDPKALEAARQQDIRIGTANAQGTMSSLSQLGFLDDAFAIAQRYTPDDADDPDFLFSPAMTALRRDPRFMTLAAKFQLPHYWRSTGHWPDFCSAADLTYACRQEAAKGSAPHP